MMQLNPFTQIPLSPPRSTRVVLVCHGCSLFNEQEIDPDWSNRDASRQVQQGWHAVEQTQRVLHHLKFDAVYSSSLECVQQVVPSLQQVNPALVPPVYIDPDLHKIDLPAWEGLTFSQVRQQFANDYQCWKRRPHELQMQRAESGLVFSPVLDLYQRVERFWHRIWSRHHGQTVLIVAHDATNQALLSTAIGLSPQHHHTLQQSYCGISILDFPETTRPQLRLLNSTYHLHDPLPNLEEGEQGFRLLLLPIDPTADYLETWMQRLAHQLRFTVIDLSMTNRSSQAKQAIAQILRHHPKALRLDLLEGNFLRGCQTITRHNVNSEQLITALAITDIEQMRHLITNAIGLSEEQSQCIYTEPGNLNILHYPRNNPSPILQSLNFNPLSVVASLQQMGS